MTTEEKIQNIHALRWIINARWFTVTLFFLFTEIVLRYVLDSEVRVPTYLKIVIPVFFYASALWLLWIIRDEIRTSERIVRFLNFFIIPSDIVIFTILLYFVGGLGSYLVTFYFFVIIASIPIYRPKGILLVALVSSISVVGEYILERTGVIPPSPFGQSLAQALNIPGGTAVTIPQNTAFAFLGTFVISIFVAAIMASFIAGGFRSTTKSLWKERNKISLIISDLPDGIIITDEFGKISFINKTIESLFNIKKEMVIGERITRTMVDEKPKLAPLYTILKERVPPGEKIEINMEQYLKTFQILDIHLHDEGKSMGAVRILHDISREKTISRLKSEFISIAAHQLRTPLSAIKWTLRMMLDKDVGSVTEEQEKFLERGYETNERMIKLVSDLLNVSRIEEGRFGYEFIPFSVEKVIDDLLPDYKLQLKKKNLKLTYKKPEEKLPPIKMDPRRMRLALQNLLENAIHYTPPQGEIALSIYMDKKKDTVDITVSDTGVGIPTHQMNRLFTKFFRAENVMRMQTEGSGLGLYIVRNIIRRHGGTIDVESEEGKGTTFSIHLPLKEEKIPLKETAFETGI